MQEMQLKSVEMGCFRASKIAKVSTQNQHQLPHNLHGLFPGLMTYIFILRKNSYHIRNVHLLKSENPR